MDHKYIYYILKIDIEDLPVVGVKGANLVASS